jgi:hydrogenase maturation protein HypF
MLERMLDDQAAGVPASSIALAFHLAIAAVVAALADALKLQQVLLAGGCFQNQLLLEACIHALKGHGIDALWPQTLPCNDSAIAVGQLMAL